MFRSLVCGSSYGEEEEDDDDYEPWRNKNPFHMPRRQRRHFFFRSQKDGRIENPYSGSGLDKFSSLMADLKERRERIRCRVREVTLVRFVYARTEDLVPTVVKAKSRNTNSREETKSGDCIRDKQKQRPVAIGKVKEAQKEAFRSRKRTFLFGEAEPSLYVAAVVTLILILLAFLGRPAAILCSSVAWYMVPALRGRRSNARRIPRKRKQ